MPVAHPARALLSTGEQDEAPDGLNNPFSPYGSPFSNQSVTNPFATDPPRLYDQQGNYRGKLSALPARLSGLCGRGREERDWRETGLVYLVGPVN